jgi:hypothetical protein
MITFNPPLNVVVSADKTVSVKDLPLVIVDVQKSKKCFAQSAPFYKTLTLWEDEAYDAIGEYTQAQAEARFLELLGADPASELVKLYVEPPTNN